jgi:hypothetical protein
MRITCAVSLLNDNVIRPYRKPTNPITGSELLEGCNCINLDSGNPPRWAIGSYHDDVLFPTTTDQHNLICYRICQCAAQVTRDHYRLSGFGFPTFLLSPRKPDTERASFILLPVRLSGNIIYRDDLTTSLPVSYQIDKRFYQKVILAKDAVSEPPRCSSCKRYGHNKRTCREVSTP